MSPKSSSDVVIRPATPDDSSACGQICYEAFSKINAAHGFPCDFPGPEVATGLIAKSFGSPGFYCVLAEMGGRIVGSNSLDERSTIAGVGPVCVDRGAQNHGLGRKLMQVVMDRAERTPCRRIRLVQAAFHNRSFSLYASLGFDIRSPFPASRDLPCNGVFPDSWFGRTIHRFGRLQRAFPSGAWIRSGDRIGASHRAECCRRSGAQ